MTTIDLENKPDRNNLRSRVLDLAVSVVIAASALLSALPGCGPLGYDKQVFRYIAMAIHRGLVPYRDLFDNKPPGIYLLFALVHDLGPMGVWVAELVVLSIANIALLVLARRLKWAIPVLYPLLYSIYLTYPPIFEVGGLTREFTASFIAVAILVTNLPGVAPGFLLGVVAGIATLFQQQDLLMLIPCAVAVLSTNQPRRWLRVGWGIVGFVVVLLPVGVWFVAHGAGDDLIEQSLLFNFRWIVDGGNSAWQRIVNLIAIGNKHGVLAVLVAPPILLTLATIARMAVITGEEKRLVAIVGAGLAIACALVTLSSRYNSHYLLVTAPFVVLLNGALFNLRLASNLQVNRIVRLLTVALLLLLWAPLVASPERKICSPVEENFRYQVTGWTELLARLVPIRGQDGQLYVHSCAGMLAANVELNVLSPTPWLYTHLWHELLLWDPDNLEFLRLLADIDQAQTAYIIDCPSHFNVWRKEARLLWLDYLHRNYQPEFSSKRFTLYRRHEASAPEHKDDSLASGSIKQK